MSNATGLRISPVNGASATDSERIGGIERLKRYLDGQHVLFVSPEDLISLKVVAARPRDLGDLEYVLLAQVGLDEAYVRRWAKELGVAEKLEELLASRP